MIRNADRLSVAEIARTRADLVQRTRDNKLKQDDLDGGTFTISNLGMFGIEQFVAVLNPPQVAILAVGSSEERVVVRDGSFAAVPLMTMTQDVAELSSAPVPDSVFQVPEGYQSAPAADILKAMFDKMTAATKSAATGQSKQ